MRLAFNTRLHSTTTQESIPMIANDSESRFQDMIDFCFRVILRKCSVILLKAAVNEPINELDSTRISRQRTLMCDLFCMYFFLVLGPRFYPNTYPFCIDCWRAQSLRQQQHSQSCIPSSYNHPYPLPSPSIVVYRFIVHNHLALIATMSRGCVVRQINNAFNTAFTSAFTGVCILRTQQLSGERVW